MLKKVVFYAIVLCLSFASSVFYAMLVAFLLGAWANAEVLVVRLASSLIFVAGMAYGLRVLPGWLRRTGWS